MNFEFGNDQFLCRMDNDPPIASDSTNIASLKTSQMAKHLILLFIVLHHQWTAFQNSDNGH
jgi:hypothetical protein